jgi:glycosyltransferase involved in cell wall biosynthesis
LSKQTPKIAFVVQRYGTDVIGGAESYCRFLAEKIVCDLGWHVSVYTSTAKDYRSWNNYYPSSRETLNGVQVIRFHSLVRRSKLLFGLFNKLMSFLWKFPKRHAIPHFFLLKLETLWFLLQGPWTPKLVVTLAREADQYEKIFFVTYLYYPTVFGLAVTGEKAVLIPTAHDELPFFSETVKQLLRDAPQILALTEAEQDLIKRNLPEDQRKKVSFLGYGLEILPLHPTAPSQFGHQTYLLYLGRISRGKDVDTLVQNFLSFAEKAPNNLILLLAGEVESDFPPTTHPLINFLGRVSEEQKLELVKHALAVVNPSAHESLSMIVIEAMMCGRPAIVNTASPVLKFYAEQTKTVLGYCDSFSFDLAISQLLVDAKSPSSGLEAALQNTQAWAHARYSWKNIFEKINSLVTDG